MRQLRALTGFDRADAVRSATAQLIGQPPRGSAAAGERQLDDARLPRSSPIATAEPVAARRRTDHASVDRPRARSALADDERASRWPATAIARLDDAADLRIDGELVGTIRAAPSDARASCGVERAVDRRICSPSGSSRAWRDRGCAAA